MDSADTNHPDITPRQLAVLQLIARLRAAQDPDVPLNEEAIIRANSALMPELRQELEKLNRIRAARVAADELPDLEQQTARMPGSETQSPQDLGPPAFTDVLSATITETAGSRIGNYKTPAVTG